MPSAQGVVSAMLLAAAGALFVPAFVETSNQTNFSAVKYGAELELVVEQFPLLVGLLALLMLGYTITR